MKIKHIIFPLVGLLVVGCGGNTSGTTSGTSQDGTSTTNPSTSQPSTSEPVTSTPVTADFDVTAFNAIFGRDVYALLPTITTSDYEIVDESSEDYPFDIYVVINDWTEANITTFEEALLDTLEGSLEEGFQLEENLFLQSYPDEASYIINIFSFPEVGEPTLKDEIDPSGLNTIFGYDIYATLPKIYSEDYEVGDFSTEEYPVDVYIDLFDWEDADAYAYDALLGQAFDIDEEAGYILTETLFIYVGLDEESYDVPVFFINIYSMSGEGPVDPVEPGDKNEIAGASLNAFFDFDVYALIPTVYSSDYIIDDYGDEDYPIDVYIDMFDWVEADAIAYLALLEAEFDLDEDWGYILTEDLFIDVFFDDQSYAPESCWSINIFSVAGGGSTPVEPVEPGVPGQTYTAAIVRKNSDQITTDIADGSINSYLSITNGPGLVVSFAANASTTKTIFNNAASEFRLYAGSGTGGEIKIESIDNVEFTSITITLSGTNTGFSVNGGATDTTTNGPVTITLAAATKSISILNVGSGQVRIKSIEVTYSVI